MRGVLLGGFGGVCLFWFSISLFSSDKLLLFWLFLELASLSLIPFYFLDSESGVLGGLFSYVVVSGVSSSLVVCGLLFDDFMIFLVVGLLLKFGLFPFMGWVYIVLVCSKWLVIWGISTILKSSFLFFSFLLSGGWDVVLVGVCCFITFIFVGGAFWLYTYGWVYYWGHVMISSSASLVMMSVEISADLLLCIFMFYFLWATAVILLLSRLSSGVEFRFNSYFFLVFLLVSFPGSVAVFYKLLMGFCIYSCGLMMFLSWVFCSISEQFYLIKCLVGTGLPRTEWGACVSF